MKALRITHDAFTFILELAMLVSLAWAGWHLAASVLVSILLAIAFPAMVIAFWGSFLAPRARRRLLPPWLQLLRFLCFETAAVLLYFTGGSQAGVVFGAAGLLNMAAAFYFDYRAAPAVPEPKQARGES